MGGETFTWKDEDGNKIETHCIKVDNQLRSECEKQLNESPYMKARNFSFKKVKLNGKDVLNATCQKGFTLETVVKNGKEVGKDYIQGNKVVMSYDPVGYIDQCGWFLYKGKKQDTEKSAGLGSIVKCTPNKIVIV